MSKWLILIIILAAAVFTLQVTGTFNVWGAVTSLPQTIPAAIGQLTSDPSTFIKDNGTALAATISSVGGCTTVFSFLYDKLKNNASQAIAQEKELRIEQNQQLLDVTNQKEAAQAMVEQLTTEKTAAVTAAENKYVESQKEVEALKLQLSQVEKEKREISVVKKFLEKNVSITENPQPIP